MKKHPFVLTAALALAATLFTAGCSTTSTVLTPAVVRQATAISVAGGVLASPQSVPEVRIAGSVICASAAATNVSPASIVASLQSAGLTNNLAESVLIVNGALLIYEVAYNSLVSTNDQATAQPYLQAVCDGFNDALPFAASMRLKMTKGQLEKFRASWKATDGLVPDWSQVPVHP
jgi:hypothetical protein